MAVTITEPTAEVASTSNAASYSLASFTPSANSLLIAFAAVGSGTSAGAISSTGGLSWVRVGTAQLYNSTDYVHVFYAQAGASPSASVISYTQVGNATGCVLAVFQVTGHNTVTPVAQVAQNATTAANPTATFSNARLTTNGTVAFFGMPRNPPTSAVPNGSWTETLDTGVNSPALGASGGYRASGETATAVTFTSASAAYGIVAVEINDIANGANCAGSATLTFGQTGAATGAGALVGSAALTCGQSGTCVGAGALAGTATCAFTPSGTCTDQGFLPTDLGSKLRFWGRADDVVLGTGVNTQRLNDKSGNGLYMEIGTANNQPDQSTSGGPNNRAYLTFDGVSTGDGDVLSGWAPNATWTTDAANEKEINIIARPNRDADDAGSTKYWQCDTLVGDSGGYFGISRNDTDQVFVGNFDGGVEQETSKVTWATNTWTRIRLRHTGGVLYMKVGTQAEVSVSSGSTDTVNTGAVRLGGGYTGSNNQFGGWDICDVIFTDPLTSTESDDLDSYFEDYYDLTLLNNGALSGTCAVALAGTATLTGAGALAGTDALTFTPSGTCRAMRMAVGATTLKLECSKRYAVEGAGNILTDTPQMDVPDWVLYGTVTDDGLTSGAGPDLVLSARKLHIPATSGTDANVAYNLVGATANRLTGSMWMRGTVGGEEVYLHIFNLTGTIGTSLRCVLTTSWQQFSVTAEGFEPFVDAVAVEVGYDGSFGALTAISASDIEVAYGQCEAGDTASYGLTAGSATLLGAGALLGTGALAFSQAGTPQASGALLGTCALALSPTATIGGAGALLGTSTLTFDQTATLYGIVYNVGTATLTFAESGALAGAGALVGSGAFAFDSAATLTGAGALLGTTTATFAQAGTVVGDGALAGSTTAVFTGSATGAVLAEIAGVGTVVFGGTGVIAGAGSIDGTTAVTWAGSATLAGAGALSGSTAVALAASGTLVGAGALLGSTTFAWAGAGTLVGAGALLGTAPVAFDGSATLRGVGALAGSAACDFGQAATLIGYAAVGGSCALTWGGAGTLEGDAPGEIEGSTAITLTATGTAQASGALAGTCALSLGAAATLQGLAPLTGATALTLLATPATLGASGSLVGSARATFSLAGTLAGSGTLVGSAAAAFAPQGSIHGLAPLAGSTSVQFTNPAATLQGLSALAGSTALAFANPPATLAGSGRLAGSVAIAFSASLQVTLTENSSVITLVSVEASTATVRLEAPSLHVQTVVESVSARVAVEALAFSSATLALEAASAKVRLING